MPNGDALNAKKVIGIRLHHLSRDPRVRQHVLQRIGPPTREPVLAVARSISVQVEGEANPVQFDVCDHSKSTFITNLNKLKPGAGNDYSDEVGEEDTSGKRKHYWKWWEDRIAGEEELHDQLRAAVIAVLMHGKAVRVYGEYNDAITTVVDRNSGDPQLVFVAPEEFYPGEGEGKLIEDEPED